MNMDSQAAYRFGLLPLVIWREASNQRLPAMVAVGWVVRNRVHSPSWWGNDYPDVILKHWQFSSFNWDDPNGRRFPKATDPSWQQALAAAEGVFTGQIPDPTDGATYYFDKSLNKNPPKWSLTAKHTVDIGDFHFFAGK